jgi:hypothetical protein
MRIIAVFYLLLIAAPVAAQGTLSGQGYGYPPGGLGTRTQGTGGALAEFDEETPLNPAALMRWGQPGLHFQYDPEYRRVTAAGAAGVRTVVGRFPVIVAAIPVGSRASLALSMSTLLDRTYETTNTARRLIGAESLYVTERLRANGGMNDIRLGGAFGVTKWLNVGVAVHAITGQNQVVQSASVQSTDPALGDSTGGRFAAYDVSLGFRGSALSAGADFHPTRSLSIGLSGRLGGPIRTFRSDTAGKDSTITRAHVPDKWGVGLRYSGIAGTVLAANVDWDGWSSMQSLGERAVARDGYTYAVGGETRGPRFVGNIVTLRAGARLRTLPYLAAGQDVKERTLAAGFGIPFAYERATMNVSAQNAVRTAGASRETAWTFGFGLTVRP